MNHISNLSSLSVSTRSCLFFSIKVKLSILRQRRAKEHLRIFWSDVMGFWHIFFSNWNGPYFSIQMQPKLQKTKNYKTLAPLCAHNHTWFLFNAFAFTFNSDLRAGWLHLYCTSSCTAVAFLAIAGNWLEEPGQEKDLILVLFDFSESRGMSLV